MNAILNTEILAATQKELTVWPHQETMSAPQWSAIRKTWKMNHKDIDTKDLLFYLFMKSSNKEMFIKKFYKGFTPLKNENKLKDNHPYNAGLHAILNLRSFMERMINLFDKNPEGKVESLSGYKVHEMFVLLGGNKETCHTCIDWLNDLYKEVYKA